MMYPLCVSIILWYFVLLQNPPVSMMIMVRAVVVLREQYISGPSAINAGTSCLQEITKAYFYGSSMAHIPNLSMIFLRGLSSPASEIADKYLKWMHVQSLNENADRYAAKIKNQILINCKISYYLESN